MREMQNILESIEKIKKEMAQLQEKLKTQTVSGKEKHGLVTTIVNGQGEIVDFQFSDGVVDEEFKIAIISSINDGLQKAHRLQKKEKENIVNQVNLPDIPGLF